MIERPLKWGDMVGMNKTEHETTSKPEDFGKRRGETTAQLSLSSALIIRHTWDIIRKGDLRMGDHLFFNWDDVDLSPGYSSLYTRSQPPLFNVDYLG